MTPDHARFMGDLFALCWDLNHCRCTKFDHFSFSRTSNIYSSLLHRKGSNYNRKK